MFPIDPSFSREKSTASTRFSQILVFFGFLCYNRATRSEAAKARLRDCNLVRSGQAAVLARSQKRPKPDCGIVTDPSSIGYFSSYLSEAAKARLRDCNRKAQPCPDYDLAVRSGQSPIAGL